MFVAVVEIGPEGHYCAVRFTDREVADNQCRCAAQDFRC